MESCCVGVVLASPGTAGLHKEKKERSTRYQGKTERPGGDQVADHQGKRKRVPEDINPKRPLSLLLRQQQRWWWLRSEEEDEMKTDMSLCVQMKRKKGPPERR